jgi:flagellar biosynthesis protein FlgN
MSLTQVNDELTVLADSYTRHLNELLELLQLEQDALKNREFETIRECTTQKEVLLSKLEQLDTQRKVIEQQAEPVATTEMRTYFSEKIASLLKKCSELNTVNGGIVEISKQFNQRMLNTILGTPAQDSDLYDAGGNNSGNKHKQVFAKI